jgi:hypothetical protein
MLRRTQALVITAVLGMLVPRGGSAADAPCSHDTLTVDGTPIAVTLCATPQPPRDAGRSIPVTVDESFRTSRAGFTRSALLEFLAGSDVSRTIDDVPLAPLGITKTLHLTLSYRGGLVRIEHALLLPGAIPLK